MKINFEFYNNNFKENKIIDETLNCINGCNDIMYEDSLNNNDISAMVYNNISCIQQNIINWYEFKNKKSVLEIGSSYGLITDFLCDNFERVVSIDWHKKRAETVSKVLNNKINLEIIVGKLNQIQLNEKFDYITFFPNYPEYEELGFEKLEDILKYLKNYLEDDGVILFATDNKFGIKNFVGASYYNENNIGSAIEKSYSKINPMLSKSMIERILLNCGLNNYRFFYPLPDFHEPSVIFSDEYLPKKNDSKLMYPLNYLDDSKIVFNENKILMQIANENMFSFFANSYLIEIKNSVFKSNNDDTIYVSYNNLRNSGYRTITKIKMNNVEKYARNKEALNHIQCIKKNIEKLNKLNFNVLDSYDENKACITSKICNEEQFSSYVINLFRNGNIEKAIEKITDYYNLLLNNLKVSNNIDEIKENNILKSLNINLNDEQIELFNKSKITKNGFIDLVFENVFYNEKDDKYLIFDQEWYFDNSPIEYILYRAVNNIYIFAELDKYYPFDKILDKLGILKFKEIFEILENNLQEMILSKSRLKQFSKSNEKLDNINVIKDKEEKLNNRIKELEKEIEEANKCIFVLRDQKKEIEDELARKEEELNSIYSSKSWKSVQKIRKIVKGK